MLRIKRLADTTVVIELLRKGHVFAFHVAKETKAESMRHVVRMAAAEEAGFDYIDARSVCLAIRAAFPEPLSHAEVLKLEWEQAKQKVASKWWKHTN